MNTKAFKIAVFFINVARRSSVYSNPILFVIYFFDEPPRTPRTPRKKKKRILEIT
ncbi:hypothetical protein [Coleofasciculus sp. H7-2]|uniref:hypothetical protein n=1 Tax=Coleofasciculus sp. H7-2 TaxID=3351545 RepID=UPI00366B1704